MTKQNLDMSAVEQLFTKLTKTFTDALEKQTMMMKSIIEKRLDVMEHDLFTIKEREENTKLENEALKAELKDQKTQIEDLLMKAGQNRGMAIESKQERLRNDLVVICPTQGDPFNVKHEKLSQPKNCRNQSGKFIYTYKFVDFQDKIECLKRRKELEQRGIKVFGPLCSEMKTLLKKANDLKDNQKVTKVWIYSDKIYAEAKNGDRYAIKSEHDIDFLT